MTCGYFFVRFRTLIFISVQSTDTSTMETKLDKFLAPFKQLKDTQDTNLQKMTEKLEQDVHARQDTAVEQVVKKLKCDRTLEFKKKGHKRQFLFNDEVKDRVES